MPLLSGNYLIRIASAKLPKMHSRSFAHFCKNFVLERQCELSIFQPSSLTQIQDTLCCINIVHNLFDSSLLNSVWMMQLKPNLWNKIMQTNANMRERHVNLISLIIWISQEPNVRTLWMHDIYNRFDAFDAVRCVQCITRTQFFRTCFVYESTLAWIDCCMDIEGQ